MYVSGGPNRPSGAGCPGCGAPPGAFPPPSMFVGAVGRGPVDVELDEEFELSLFGGFCC